jgi:hypothetical protein
MSGITGWNNTLGNLAQSMQNLWITVCDMRTAVNSIRQSILPDCANFLLGFTSSTDGGRNNITLIFNGLTTIPVGFSNCPKISTVSITDGLVTYTSTFDLVAVATDSEGITFDATAVGLNTSLPYTITVNGCIINGETTCSKTVSGVNTPVTTTTTSAPPKLYSVNITQGDIDLAIDNTDAYFDGKVWVSYISDGYITVVTPYSAITAFTICVASGTTPIIYFFKSDTVETGESVATDIGVCAL